MKPAPILFAQLSVFLGAIVFEIIRNWLMLYIGTKISISIISDFLSKLLKLPIKYFDTKLVGDFNQQIQDNERIEHFNLSKFINSFFNYYIFGLFWRIMVL